MADEKEYILVAEDSAPNRTILCHLLKMFGFDVIACEDGALALEEVKNLGDRKLVAIFSDLMMPNLDGLGFLQGLREIEGFDEDIPFVFVSAVLDGDQVMQAMELGINDYLLKPASKEKVQEKLQEIFPERKIELQKKTG